MKTNQLMTARFHGLDLHVEHKTTMTSLTDVFTIGNMLRLQEGKKTANLSEYVSANRTREYIQAAANVWGFDPDAAVQVRGRGNTKSTMVHIAIAIHAAEYLSPTFHAEVIKEFIQGRLLQYRDESGDEFISLNKAIDTLPDRVGLSNFPLYVNVAKKVKAKVSPDGESWNTASAHQLRERMEIEQFILRAIEVGLIQTYPQMFNAIDNYKPRF